ncbi:hypothetical protein AVEN_146882-1 [Araneus ventricosus]|uniref:RNase H type-1 domain-containing protein n=1 Tax=Araneus ventricosus TaxID=182803 RepID=A0A4Y2I138_ARAVE|nr:hypothetical protein AVEN_146882-1 [Araneus ventricosus]
MEEDTAKYEWMPQICPFNTVFQAEFLATQEACLWASRTNQQVKVWSDSESSLHSIASIDIKSPIAQRTQEILLKSTDIRLGWIRTHVGFSGNEAADKEGNTGGNPYIHPSAKKPYQDSASKRIHHPLAKRKGQWRNRQECLQRFA